jgi:hypothetical protein
MVLPLAAALGAIAAPVAGARAGDCNLNGLEDALDVRPRSHGFSTIGLLEAPRALAATDVDGDGDLDLAAAVPAGVRWLLRSAGGVYENGDLVPVGLGPRDVLAADLDGDGDADLATANFDDASAPPIGGVSIALNRGRGEFSIPRNFGIAGEPTGLAAADIDGDGDIDLIAAASRPASLSAFRNLGDGGFDVAFREVLTPLEALGDFGAADIDGDGKVDVVLTDSSNVLSILRGDGDGRFALERRPLEDGASASAVALADFDGEGAIDLISFDFSQERMLLFRAVGGASPLAGTPLAEQPDHAFAIRRMRAADLDGDGDPDLAVASATHQGVLVFENLGGGGFLPPIAYWTSTQPADVLVADVDGDGDADLATASPIERDIAIIESVAAGRFRGASAIYVDDLDHVAHADLDGDGDIDAALSSEDSSGILAAFNDGDGGFSRSRLLGAALQPCAVFAADLDGDGDADLMAPGDFGREGYGLLSLSSDGGGVFEERFWKLPEPGYQKALAFDLDRDRDPDLVLIASRETPLLVFARNDGRGGFGEAFTVETGAAGGLQDIAVADLDGDLDDDVAALHVGVWRQGGSGYVGAELTLLYQSGDGGFRTARAPLEFEPQTLAVAGLERRPGRALFVGGFCADCEPGGRAFWQVYRSHAPGEIASGPRLPAPGLQSSLAAADLDGDRRIDAAITDEARNRLLIRFQGEDGEFRAPLELPTGSTPSLVGAADIDGDGRLDLVNVSGTATCACVRFILEFYFNLGAGAFAEPMRIPSAGPVLAIEAIDLDGDGLSDLGLSIPDSYVACLNRGRPPESRDRNFNGVPDECEPRFHRGDASGEGRVDLSDAIRILAHLFLGGAAPSCADAADANDDGELNIADAAGLLGYLFVDGRRPEEPGPPPDPCGVDPDGPGAPGNLGCEAYPGCR